MTRLVTVMGLVFTGCLWMARRNRVQRRVPALAAGGGLSEGERPVGVPTRNLRLPSARVRRVARTVLGRRVAAHRLRSERLRRLVDGYEVGDLLDLDGSVPVRWWIRAPNFGDLLSPWLVGKMTGRDVVFADFKKPHYLVIGSLLNRANPRSHVWGTGAFGTEDGSDFETAATYHAVRGPLSRVRLLTLGVDCPEVYGDPALLAPAYFAPQVPKTHQYGIVARWSEQRWREADLGPGVRLIDLGTDDVEGVIEAVLSCRRIVTGSLHGLIIADAYGIPSAWVRTATAHGGQYKFYDYFASVQKSRYAQDFDTSLPVLAGRLRDSLQFDGRPIVFDHRKLLDACPFLVRSGARPPREPVAGLASAVRFVPHLQAVGRSRAAR